MQCPDGHLFCAMCLQRYSKEATYGQGKTQLFCMTDGCGTIFPLSQLRKALPDDLMQKYMERVQDEDIKLANIDNLVKCPRCDFAAVMPDGDKVFKCQNSECMQESCRYCQEDWKDHWGVPCKEVEKKDAKNLRTTYEEKMTAAKVRKCWSCSTIFLKTEGCNKMTCRCGAKYAFYLSCVTCKRRAVSHSGTDCIFICLILDTTNLIKLVVRDPLTFLGKRGIIQTALLDTCGLIHLLLYWTPKGKVLQDHISRSVYMSVLMSM